MSTVKFNKSQAWRSLMSFTFFPRVVWIISMVTVITKVQWNHNLERIDLMWCLSKVQPLSGIFDGTAQAKNCAILQNCTCIQSRILSWKFMNLWIPTQLPEYLFKDKLCHTIQHGGLSRVINPISKTLKHKHLKRRLLFQKEKSNKGSKKTERNQVQMSSPKMVLPRKIWEKIVTRFSLRGLEWGEFLPKLSQCRSKGNG